MQAALGLLAAAALGLPNMCVQPAGLILCVRCVYSIHISASRRVTRGAVFYPMLLRRGVFRESVYTLLEKLLSGFSSGAEGGGRARGLFG